MVYNTTDTARTHGDRQILDYGCFQIEICKCEIPGVFVSE
jgi:hypothetical protein